METSNKSRENITLHYLNATCTSPWGKYMYVLGKSMDTEGYNTLVTCDFEGAVDQLVMKQFPVPNHLDLRPWGWLKDLLEISAFSLKKKLIIKEAFCYSMNPVEKALLSVLIPSCQFTVAAALGGARASLFFWQLGRAPYPIFQHLCFYTLRIAYTIESCME